MELCQRASDPVALCAETTQAGSPHKERTSAISRQIPRELFGTVKLTRANLDAAEASQAFQLEDDRYGKSKVAPAQDVGQLRKRKRVLHHVDGR